MTAPYDNRPRRGPAGAPSVDAVRGVDLTLAPHETPGSVGESGSGTSTHGTKVTGLKPATSGRIMFQGPCATLTPAEDVGRTIGEPWLVHPDVVAASDRRRVTAELLDAVGPPRVFVGRYPAERSGGRRRRVGIARAPALRPQFLVCDEPVSSSDLTVQKQILGLRQAIQSRYALAYSVASAATR